MGKRKKHVQQHKRFKPQENYEDQRERNWIMEKRNAKYEAFYKAQNFIPETEWDQFIESMQTPLPVAFRITGSSSHAKQLQKFLEKKLQSLVNVEVDGIRLDPPIKLPWYPNGLAWQINANRGMVRKSLELKKLHQLLLSENEGGSISRQEAVSMIPPILLQIQSHHKVLDMCAAPGSKTGQLLEALHSDDSELPDGFIVANDMDNKRCYLMMHQVKRLQSPCVAIVNHNAITIPPFYMEPTSVKNRQAIKFDRILCDVPCGGDGTLRKNLDIWKKWNVASGFNLHTTQFRILKKGLEYLAVGGRLVYSTCSLNPIEDEAIIAEMLNLAEGSVQLIDTTGILQGLKTVPGVTSWKCMSKDCEFYEAFSEIPDKLKSILQKTMFPPENVKDLNLERCIRVLPHHQNTGGFFVALLEKTNELPWLKKRKALDDNESDEAQCKIAKINNDNSDSNDLLTIETEKQKSNIPPEDPKGVHKLKIFKDKIKGYKEDPYIFFENEEEPWISIKNYFGISDELDYKILLTRSNTKQKKKIYLASPSIKRLVQCNEDRIRFINLGLKIFGRVESKTFNIGCDYRLFQEGMTTIDKYVKSRRILFTKQDMITILNQENPFFTKFTDSIHKELLTLSIGPIIIEYLPSKDDDCCQLVLCGWRGRTSCRTYTAKLERAHYLRLFGKELNYDNNDIRNNETNKVEDSENIGNEKDDNLNTESIENEITNDKSNDNNE